MGKQKYKVKINIKVESSINQNMKAKLGYENGGDKLQFGEVLHKFKSCAQELLGQEKGNTVNFIILLEGKEHENNVQQLKNKQHF